MMYKCVQCGFEVDKPESLCVACEEKRAAKAPAPHWQLAPQPAPPGFAVQDGPKRDDDDDDEEAE